MKNKKKQPKLELKKFTVAKLNNLKLIKGGSDPKSNNTDQTITERPTI